MKFAYLIKGGTVVDGTGAPAYKADVRIRDGLIAEIASDLAPLPRERVFDADGCHVTPGFVELHNHWDGAIWWSPDMDPLPGYGVTTSINGNCGFSAAPISDDPVIRREIVDIFNFFEDIPEEAMLQLMPWSWRKWSEYQQVLKSSLRLPVNFASYCGHIPLRLATMGLDAWERAATDAEITQMCELLDDALVAGALGLSSNLIDNDKHNRPICSKLADDKEWGALLDVVSRHPGATLQVPTDNFMRKDSPESGERLARLAGPRGIRMQWSGVPQLMFQADLTVKGRELHERFRAEGHEFYTMFHHESPTSMMNFIRSLVFAQNGNPVWHELIETPTEEGKLALLADPAWRDRARDSWDHQYPHSYLNFPDKMFLHESESGCGPVGCSLAEYMHDSGFNHASDAMAEWLLVNGVESTILKTSWERNAEIIVELLRDPMALGNLSDSGAHGKMFCGAGDNISVLTKYVRDLGRITIEEGINLLTWRSANFFGLHDRGRLLPGMRADLVVFNLDEIERRPEERLWDVPDGHGARTYRYTRKPAPMRFTLVNGVPTFDHGAFTGKFPGEFIGPAPELPTAEHTNKSDRHERSSLLAS
jgi:N-acyl-D-amino-acid deacylase